MLTQQTSQYDCDENYDFQCQCAGCKENGSLEMDAFARRYPESFKLLLNEFHAKPCSNTDDWRIYDTWSLAKELLREDKVHAGDLLYNAIIASEEHFIDYFDTINTTMEAQKWTKEMLTKSKLADAVLTFAGVNDILGELYDTRFE